MKARYCNPRPKLTDAVTCLHQFVIQHVEQITQLRLLPLVHNTSGRIPQGCPHTRPPNQHTRNMLCPPFP
jgi:hypothetical protein